MNDATNDAPVLKRPVNANGACAECGSPLPADISVAICPLCELRGALNLFEEPSQITGGHGSSAGDSSASPLPARPMLNQDAGAFCPRRFGDYELLEEIAHGGMGIVYRARQVSLDRIVAVKMLLAGPMAGKNFVQRFRTEAAATASLQHPNIVAIHEVGFAQGQHFFAMDYVEGLTLGQLVAKGLLPARQAARYVKIIAEAIHFAHERNVLHRDLKPSNVLIDSATNQPRITDFGLAKRLEAETELTLSGQVLGSPNFMSPEQATAKRGAVGKRSDVYSLGAILYHVLTGRPPFHGQTLTDVLHQVVNNEPLAPHLLTPQVPHDLETICLKCLEKEPSRRYQTAQEFADELGRFLRDEPIKARPASAVEKGWRWCRRKPAIACLSAATLLLLLAVAIGSPIATLRIARERDSAQRERKRADQNVYDLDVRLAQTEWEAGDLGHTRSLLDAHLPRGEGPDRRGFEWYYFWNLSRGDQRLTLTNHNQAVNCVALSPDGRLVATGSAGSPVRIWDCATGKEVATLPELHAASLAFTPDGQALGVGGQDQLVVWNLETRRVIFKLEEAFARFQILFSPVANLLVLGKHAGAFQADGGSAELWDYVANRPKQVFPDSGGRVALSLRGDKLATGLWNQTTKIWDLRTGQLVRTLETGPIVTMAISANGQTLAGGYWSPEVKLWDTATGLPIGWLTNNPSAAWRLAFSPDDRSMITGGADQMVHIWDVATLRQTAELRGHGSEIVSLAVSADGRTLASGSKDKKAMLWSAPFRATRAVTTRSNLVSHPIFSADGQLVAAGIEGHKVAIWDVATLQLKAEVPDAHDALAFSTDSHALVVRGTNYLLKTFDVFAGSARGPILDGPGAENPDYAVLSPDGQTLVVGSIDGTLTFFDARTGVKKATAPHTYGHYFFPFSFSPNGKILATVGQTAEAEWDGPAKIWDALTCKLMPVAPGSHTDGVLAAAFSPDNSILATSSVDTSIRFWDTRSWKEIPPSLGHKEFVRPLAFSPNGRTLVSASADGTMKFWNVSTRRELASLALPSGDVPKYFVFSPDGQTLAGWGWDGALRLWRAPFLDKNPSRQRDD